jgi:hypothetical protein
MSAFTTLIAEVLPTEHMIISALALLSNSMRSGQSLPPFIPLPKPFELTHELIRLSVTNGGDDDATESLGILDLRNVEQYGYAEFAVIQVCATHMRDDIDGIIRAVSELVGVVDFSPRVSS